MSLVRCARQASVALAVAALHVAGLLTWWTMGSDMRMTPSPGAAPSIAVWLPTLLTPPTELAKPRRPETLPRLAPTRSGDTADQPRTAGLAFPAASGAAAEVPAQSALVETPTPPAPSLNLTLSRPALAPLVAPSFADRSPFHGRLPATVERQIAAAAAETGPWTEERIDNDHFRLRRGSTCVMMERPQAAILDPFSDAARRMPWRASYSQC